MDGMPILNENTIELHYWFNDDSHTMNAIVFNKCEYEFLGIVKENKDGIITLEQRNYFKTGTTVQFISPNKKTFNYEINEIFDEEMNIIKEANHAQMIVKIKANLNVEKDDIMRLKVFDICDDL